MEKLDRGTPLLGLEGKKTLLPPVEGRVFLLTSPFIERAYRTFEVLVRHASGNATNQASESLSLNTSAFLGTDPPSLAANFPFARDPGAIDKVTRRITSTQGRLATIVLQVACQRAGASGQWLGGFCHECDAE